MKLLLFLLLVILPASSVHSQEVRQDIKQAIANWYSESGHGHLITITKVAQAHPSQEVRQDIKRALWHWKPGHGHLINTTKVGQAHPSRVFIDKYDPKETYCVVCKAASTLRKVRVIVPFGGPPESEKVISEETIVSDARHIAIIAQSGEIELINVFTMPGPIVAPPPPFPCKVRGLEDKVKEGEDKVNRETKFRSLWREVCPFPWE